MCASKSSLLLCGKTIGAQMNRILTEMSLSLLIVSGNYKARKQTIDVGTGDYACLISTNQIGKKYKNLKTKYSTCYETWMESAVSNLINQIDSITPVCILFPNSNDPQHLFFDMLIKGTIEKKARVYVVKTINDANGQVVLFELFIDTVFFDKGVWSSQ